MQQSWKRCLEGGASSTTKRSKPGRAITRKKVTKPSTGLQCNPSAVTPVEADSNDTDTATEVLDSQYLELRQALRSMKEKRRYLHCGNVTHDVVQTQMLSIMAALKAAVASHERCFDCFEHDSSLPVLQPVRCPANNERGSQVQWLSRPARFMRLAADLLRDHIFSTDLLGWFCQKCPLPDGLAVLQSGKVSELQDAAC